MAATLLPLVDERIVIDRPVETVFDFISNHENYANWFPGVISVEAKKDAGGNEVGQTYEEVLRMPSGRHRPMTITVAACVSPNHFKTVGDFPPLMPSMVIDCAAGGPKSTCLRLRFFSRQKSTLLRMLIKISIPANHAPKRQQGTFNAEANPRTTGSIGHGITHGILNAYVSDRGQRNGHDHTADIARLIVQFSLAEAYSLTGPSGRRQNANILALRMPG